MYNNNNDASKPQTTINPKAYAIYEYRPTNNVEGKVCEDSGGKITLWQETSTGHASKHVSLSGWLAYLYLFLTMKHGTDSD